jgi:phenylacetate-CoA ligase
VPNFAGILYFLGTALRRLQWSKQKLKEYQEKRLRAVLRHAYDSVPLYHEKFRRAGLSPSDVKSLEDLAKLPITRKDELRQVDPLKLVSGHYRIEELKVLRTSGSHGKPFRFYISHSEDDWRKSIYLRANISCGQRPRDRWVVITAPRHFSDTTNIQRLLRIYAQRCISVFDRVDEQAQVIRKAKADVLDGYSGALFLLAKEAERQGIREIQPRLVFGSADLIDESSSKLIERVFNAPYYDQFGCAEVDRTAWQCPEKVGYHMDADSVITQFVDSEGNEVSPGETGEIVYTSLFNFAMPFIRYSIEDLGKPSSEVCPCGRTLPLMEVVVGRKDSLLILPNQRVISPRALTVAMSMFEYYENIDQFRVVQKKEDLFEVFIKMKNNTLTDKVVERKLSSHFCEMLGLSLQDVTFDVNFVESIPLSKSGRLMAVTSEVKRQPSTRCFGSPATL